MFHRATKRSLDAVSMPLGDGGVCIIRAIGAEDRALLLSCFEGLSARSRRMRFFAAKPALTESDLAFLTSADEQDHIALAAIRLDERGAEAECLGAARCIRLPDHRQVAEFAVAVVDAAHRLGIGRALLSRLGALAWEQDIRFFRCEVLPENEGMRALATRFGGEARWIDGGTLEFEYALAEPEAEEPPLILRPIIAFGTGVRAWTGAVDKLLDVAFDLGRSAMACWFDAWPVRSNLPLDLKGWK